MSVELQSVFANLNVRNLSSSGVALLAGVALVGCNDGHGTEHQTDTHTNPPSFRHTKDPLIRYTWDYGGNYVNEFGVEEKTGCLTDSSYSVARVGATISEDQDGKKVIKIEPRSKKLKALHFTGFEDTTKPLQPQDKYTRSILEDAGCEMK